MKENPMNIKQFRYSADNFAYLAYGRKQALVIDGGAVNAVLAFVKERGLELKYAANTHSHPDHTVGTKEIVNKTGAQYLENRALRENGKIDLDGEIVEVLHTPGHTSDSLTFCFDGILVTGDTLFNGTVGNPFSGDLDGFFASVKKLISFPGDTIVYAGHDYVEESVAFARKLEPDNENLDKFLKAYDPKHVFSTIGDELRINPYARFNDVKMTAILEKMGYPAATELERWNSLMSIE